MARLKMFAYFMKNIIENKLISSTSPWQAGISTILKKKYYFSDQETIIRM